MIWIFLKILNNHRFVSSSVLRASLFRFSPFSSASSYWPRKNYANKKSILCKNKLCPIFCTSLHDILYSQKRHNIKNKGALNNEGAAREIAREIFEILNNFIRNLMHTVKMGKRNLKCRQVGFEGYKMHFLKMHSVYFVLISAISIQLRHLDKKYQ